MCYLYEEIHQTNGTCLLDKDGPALPLAKAHTSARLSMPFTLNAFENAQLVLCQSRT